MDCTSKILLGTVIASLMSSPITTSGQTVIGAVPTIATATGRTHVTPIAYRLVPASLQFEQTSSVSAWIVPSRLSVRELQTVHALGVYRTEDWSAALEIGSLSMDRYAERAVTAMGSIPISSTLSTGITLSYTMAQARGFAAEHLLTINAQMVFALDSLTMLGIAATNVGQAQRAGASTGSSSSYRIGVSRRIAAHLLFDADVVLPLRMASGLTAAIRWDAMDILSLRVAYTTVPPSAEASLCLAAIERVSILSTLHYHLTLGASPTVGIAYQW